MSLTSKTVTELSQMLSSKEISSIELTKAYLSNIEEDNKNALPTNAYITVTPELALAGARSADERIQKNTHTKLTGIPLGVKDLINVKGIRTTCASKIMGDYIAPYDATVITKLIHDEGMTHLGKLNLDEFAMGSSNETSYYGVVRNPLNREYCPGGSSGGSSAAIAGKLAPITLGTDTGGSIRQPAAFCGCVGFKPTYGRVSRYGAVAFASSLDQIGPIAQSVEDAALLYNALSGHDKKDSTTLNTKVKPVTLSKKNLKGLRIGVPKEFFVNELDNEIKEKVIQVTKDLEKEGAILSEVSLPNIKHAPAIYYIIAPAEASANLERFDGIRFGYRAPSELLSETYIKSRTEGFGTEVKRRLILGTFILSSESYNDFFVKAQQLRHMMIDEFDEVYKNVDIVLGPTTPTTAFKLNKKYNDPVAMYLNDIFTIPANLIGSPSISLPVGLSSENMPIGLQLMGRRFEDEQILNYAYSIEQLYK
ncbi:MAG: Asp-tRNA(Asn)/Glu-tRNA(Gln) amidotransferase subunit GatA [Brevinema sp.]